MPKIKDISGQKFNRLTVIGKARSHVTPCGAKVGQWLCRCDCGEVTIVGTSHLISGHTKSCGCYAKETSKANGQKTKHGLTFSEDGKKSRVYRIWTQMKTRCFNNNDVHYADYGDRGITVCDEWANDFQVFYDWAMANGYADNLSIDRKDVNGNYEPSNCRWATAYEQTNNRRNTAFVEYEGKIHTLAEWSELTGICYQTLFARYKAGKSPADILKK